MWLISELDEHPWAQALDIRLSSHSASKGLFRSESERIAKHIQKLTADANRQLQAEKLSAKAQSMALGPVPSLRQCIDGLQEIRYYTFVFDLLCISSA